MKKAQMVFLFVLSLLLCGCRNSEDTDGKTVLTIATDDELKIGEAVAAFNEAHNEYEIVIKNYTPEDADRLNAELSSGDIPDMFCFGSNFYFERSPFRPEQYEAKGMLADIYSYLDSDEALDRESFFENILSAAENENGALYVMPVSFWIDVVVGDASVVGEDIGWTFSEMQRILEEHPNVKCAFGPYMTQDDLLGFLLSFNYDVFVDWDTGTNRFNTEEFWAVLSFVKTHYENIPDAEDRSEYDLIREGEQLLMYGKLGRFDAIQKYYHYFATDDITFIGFPTEMGAGNALSFDISFAISAYTQHGDICWDFMREFLMEDYEDFPFPVNKSAFENRVENLAEYEVPGAKITVGTGDSAFTVAYTESTDEQIEKVIELINSLDRVTIYDRAVFDIVWEEAQSYFAGDKTVDVVSKQIADRVGLYMSEQG